MLKPGTMLGPHEIVSLLGAGGMGEVYKARDTRLDRLVAIKILPQHLLADRPELRERFEREARAIANLKHPHICVLYDVGEQDGIHYLVMEHLEGVTLAERLKKGPLPLDEVLRYAVEVSDALDKAHRAKVTHRDIKPANIMLTREGSKLLDFGLAKLKLDILDATVPPSERPTVPGALTQHGTLLGTLQYMAPEQLECKDDKVESRTDIFAFGTVVYEMVTGKKAFPGDSQASVIAGILERQPVPMTSLQPPGTIVPPALDRTVRRCFAKDPEDRWQTARDLVQELRWIADAFSHPELSGSDLAVAPAPVRPRASRRQLVLGSVAALVLAALVGLGAWTLKPAPPLPVTRTVINLPEGQRLAGLEQPAIALSPDGSQLAYVATQGGMQQLYLRSMDSLEAGAIPNTEGAVNPFFSPDGQWVGFFAGGKLMKVSVSGGAAVTLSNAAFPRGASWDRGGMIAFSPTTNGPIQQVPSAGGTPQPLTRIGTGEVTHRWPEFLPGGTAVLFVASSVLANWTTAQVAVQSVETGERQDLASGGTNPRYAPTGHLVYAQSGALMAVPFDPQRLAVEGTAVPIVEGVLQSLSSGDAQFSVSATGALVYVPGNVLGSQRRLVWVSRNGAEQALDIPARAYRNPRLSPDGRRVAASIEEQETQIWLYDLARQTLTRLTFEANNNSIPAWTPDGKRIAFFSNRTGPLNIFWQLADGSGGLERLTTGEYLNAPHSWSPDGQLLAFTEVHPSTGNDIWVLPLKDRKPQPFLRTPYSEGAPRFSPDGRWLAYASTESGRNEIYVQPYPGPGGKWQISAEGGTEPVWNPNGRELFYRSGDRMMAVEITTQPSFAAGRPRILFEAGQYLPTPAVSPNYDVSPDGQRFLMLKAPEQEAAPTQINVVLNWFEELKRRVPTAR